MHSITACMDIAFTAGEDAEMRLFRQVALGMLLI